MAIHTDNAVSGQQGFAKELDSKSTSILLDLTQENQYQYPVQSTIRELVSNAVDSTTEKFNALDILSGAPVSKYFVEKEGEVYHASGWKPEYFSPEHLSSKQTVRIELEQRGQEHQRDILRVTDEGVGLWGDRLMGYTKVSYSTKRLNASTLGRFGIGAKAPLSMDVPSFRIITTYEGKRTALDIYNRKVEPVYGKWDAEGKLRESFILRPASTKWENGVEVLVEEVSLFYDTVDAPNAVTIEVETKKVERQNLLNAIKSQLLFFTTVELWVKPEWSENYQQQTFLANILYEDEYIILSDNNQYSKPHLVLDNGNTKVCYGAIDFGQLEVAARSGNIGLKIKAEDVDIVPSREYVKWGSKTRETVLSIFSQAEKIATALVEKELQEEDPLKWLQKAASVFTNMNYSSVLGRLSNIVDKDSITPTFPGTTIKYTGVEEMLMGAKVRNVSNQSYGHQKPNISRADIYSWSQVNFGAFYVTTGVAHRGKDIYLTKERSNFTLLTIPEAPEYDGTIIPSWVDRNKDVDQQLKAAHAANLAKWNLALERIEWLQQSALVLDYDSLDVPDEVLEEIEAEEHTSDEPTPAQLRKLAGKVYMKCFSNYGDTNYYQERREPTMGDVQVWSPDTDPIIYGFQEDKEKLGFYAAMLRSATYPKITSAVVYWDSLKILQVSKEVGKKLPAHAVHVDDFRFSITPTTINLHPMLRPWYTTLQVKAFLETVPFMYNYGVFHSEMHSLYVELKEYVKVNQPNTNFYGNQATMYKELLETADKMAIFEEFCKEHSTEPELVAEKSTELFGKDTVTGSKVWDTDIQDKLEKLKLYCQPLVPLFNEFKCLTNTYAMSAEVEQGIRTIIHNLGVQTL